MEDKWQDISSDDELDLLVHVSRLLGSDKNLVLHGGGNTSLKREETDHTGRKVRVLRVKGSGTDLSEVERSSFVALRMGDLDHAKDRHTLSDADLVNYLRKSKIDPDEPEPSVETFMHAFIPEKFVLHSHADAILSLTNTDVPDSRLREILGKVEIIPYTHPGFELALSFLRLSGSTENLEGIVIRKHGLFTFSNSAKEAYRKHISIVERAEKYLSSLPDGFTPGIREKSYDFETLLPKIRGAVSKEKKKIVLLDRSEKSMRIACSREAKEYCSYGPATPDMLIRTRYDFLYIRNSEDAVAMIREYAEKYRAEFKEYVDPSYPMHDPYPAVMVLEGGGIIIQSTSIGECRTILELAQHSFDVAARSAQVGNHEFLSREEAFAVEYWPPEMRKLKKMPERKLQGTVSVVTGAASGIGLEAFKTLSRNGSYVIACDIDPEIKSLARDVSNSTGTESLPYVLNLKDADGIREMFNVIVKTVGGVDFVFNNAGILKSDYIEDVKIEDLDSHYAVNSRGTFLVSQLAFGIMKLQGIGGNFVFNITKNLTHPGPGMLSYGSSKAFAAQMCHYFAIEGGKYGIRANIINPDKIFKGSKIWEGGVLEKRARAKGQTVEEYKRNNLLRVEVLPSHVANVMLALLDDATFGATTDAMIPVDGGVI